MKKTVSIFVTLLISQIVFSQCLTDHYHQKAKATNPSIHEIEELFNASVVQIGHAKRATKYIIPVVFHVIHTNGPENISKQQIEDQIRILNEDFSLSNPNKNTIRAPFVNLAADCEIEFRLARIDPSGNCTDGINRVYSPTHVNVRDEVKSVPGARWDYRRYLNVWTVTSIADVSGLGGTTLGYAYLPSAVASGFGSMDGIVMRADYVGTIGTAVVSAAGRTLTHEVGHYLGLFHTFEDGCQGTGGNQGDLCADTPPVAGPFTNSNCPVNGNSCNTDNPNLIDQWENYMDYSSGSCQSMFSLNQKSRMHAVITGYSFRSNLVSANNLTATGVLPGNTAPTAYFSSSSRTVCTGEPVTFYDQSCKATIDSRQWQFSGASITSTNKDTPVVTYSNPGLYRVSLTVNNGNGSNTLAVDNYIEVRPRVAIDKPSVSQNFDSPTWNVGTGWKVLDPGTFKFTRDSTTGYRNNTCVVAPVSASTPAGQRFQLVTPPVDLRPLSGKNPKISMMVGYLRQNTSSSEELRFYYSRGCSNGWTQFLYRNASFLSYNTGQFANNFKPSEPGHWKQITFSLSTYENDSNISFMIEINSGEGNPVYIDEINIGQFNTAVRPVYPEEVNVYPNPAANELHVSFAHTGGMCEVWLENVEGKRIDTLLPASFPDGDISLNYKRNPALTAGMYILKIRSGNQIINKKVIFAN